MNRVRPTGFALLPIDADASEDRARAVVRDWADEHVPVEWRKAAAEGGPAAVRHDHDLEPIGERELLRGGEVHRGPFHIRQCLKGR